MTRKYEFTGETSNSIAEGATLHRIRAVRDFGNVKAGDLGGWIQKEENLNHSGDCWIYDRAAAFGNARVSGNASLRNEALAYDNAFITDHALIERDASVFGRARIYDRVVVTDRASIYRDAVLYGRTRVQDRAVIGNFAYISGNDVLIGGDACIQIPCSIRNGAYVMSNRDFLTIGPIGSENGVLTAYRSKDGLMVNRGCFTGTLDVFKAAVEETHGDNKYGRSYAALVEFIKVHFGEEVRRA
ncbi:hypothetical protein [Paenibacillus thiaminolyticus]|uniref:hypothetical protein n=1 Tax=Paenibacillus thiaminolyticus TaxID=49283 RepID=UPI002543BA26|nr:hypothetical protein [Paenibacillus thiaminolyticus]WII39673.1 hypothetical protein O0V01_11505 [Paenibacillus thiaminolyticus]